MDRAAEAAAELGPVFARLAEVQAECARMRERVERRLPGLVDRVVAAVLATGAEDALSATTREAP